MSAIISFGKLGEAWRKFAPASVWRVLTVCALFTSLPLIAIYYSREPEVSVNMKGIAGAGGMAGQGEAKLDLSADIDDGDPVARFSDTRVGHILFAPSAGDYCRRVLFHNRTGALIEGRPILCVTTMHESKLANGADRLLALRKSFQK